MNRIHMALLAVPALLLLSTQNAYAYLDPGTGSMILQGLIGGIAGGMFAIRIYWGKLKILGQVEKPVRASTGVGVAA